MQQVCEILIESGLLLRAGRLCRRALPQASSALLVTDANVAPLYAQTVADAFSEAGLRVRTVVLPAGEQTKQFAAVAKLYEELCDFRLTDADFVAALGGGVIGDAAGFAASSYLGGVPLVQIPTTLCAQARAADVGSFSLHLPQGRELVHMHGEPICVLVDPDCLMSLPPRAFAAGIAEVIRIAAVSDAALFESVSRLIGRAEAMARMEEVLRACRGAFEADLAQRRDRFAYGQCFAEAIGRACRYRTYGRGERLAAGMCRANAVGELLGITPPRTANAVRAALERFSLPVRIPLPHAMLEDALRADRCRSGDRFAIPFLEEIGRVRIESLTVQELLPLCGED